MSKHTPGPWVIGAIESGMMAVDGANGEEVTGFVSPADARLIAAAPDLLQALKVISVWAANGGGLKDFMDIQKCAEEAIAKATGGSDD